LTRIVSQEQKEPSIHALVPEILEVNTASGAFFFLEKQKY
jgi:hypothetical protein